MFSIFKIPAMSYRNIYLGFLSFPCDLPPGCIVVLLFLTVLFKEGLLAVYAVMEVAFVER